MSFAIYSVSNRQTCFLRITEKTNSRGIGHGTAITKAIGEKCRNLLIVTPDDLSFIWAAKFFISGASPEWVPRAEKKKEINSIRKESKG